MGNVFSPYYFRARKRLKHPDPENFSAFNIAIYSNKNKKWCLTERGKKSVHRSADHLHIGPSSATWDGNCLEFHINEYTSPIPTKVKGKIRVYPEFLNNEVYSLDENNNHSWWPASPSSKVEIEFQQPNISWKGNGYFDANWGNEPLENRFKGWNWSCAKLHNGERAITYNLDTINESNRKLFLHFDNKGVISQPHVPSIASLANTKIWRIPRKMSTESDKPINVVRTLEDTPFYSRSIVSSYLFEQPVCAMHESLDLTRFKKTSTQLMLPFRLPRNTFN